MGMQGIFFKAHCTSNSTVLIIFHPQVTTLKSEGISQLNEDIGTPVIGDYVGIRYRAFALIDGKRKKFADTYQHSTLPQFQLGDKQLEGLYVGLTEGILTMNLGEEATLTIPAEKAFGKQGLTKANYPEGPKAQPKADHKTRNPMATSYVTIGPDVDIQIEVELIKVSKNGKWHCKQVHESSGAAFLCKCLTGNWGVY